jgi:AAA15 family ATPase/GTPase
MLKAIFTIKNYRCFEDTEPLVIEINPGFTALVGPNNSGKSSFLKFFHEFRHLWQYLANERNINELSLGNSYTINLIGLYEPIEIFSVMNQRNLSIEIEFIVEKSEPKNYLSLIKLEVARSSPNVFKGQVFYSTMGMTAKRSFSSNKTIRFDHCAEFFNGLLNSIYISAFRNAINEGGSSYYDLQIGTAFINTWNAWKTGNRRAENNAIIEITNDIRSIFDYDTLEINATDDRTTLQVIIDGSAYKLREIGSGISQFIIVLGNAGIRKPSFIFIDEPEINLHPSLQVDFLTSLASYASKGIIYATHSIGLARTTAEHIFSFQKNDCKSQVKPFDQVVNYPQFLGELSFTSYKELGFEKILLVEGVKDVKTFQQFLRKIKKDHQIVILPLGGDQLARGGVESELAELRRISTDISAIVDSEREIEGGDPAPQRKAFCESCSSLQFEALATERRAIENYFTARAIKAVLGNEYNQLGPYERLKECSNPWSKSDNFRIAREMTWDEIKETDVGKFIENISN